MHSQIEENSQKKLFSFNYNERDIKKDCIKEIYSFPIVLSGAIIIIMRNYYEIRKRKINKIQIKRIFVIPDIRYIFVTTIYLF